MTPNRFNRPTSFAQRLRANPTRRTQKDRSIARSIARSIDHTGIANMIAATIEDARSLPSFALKLQGDALAPDFRDGDLLTVAPDVAPLPGDAVVVVIRGKYGCMLLNADGDAWDRDGGFVPKGEYTVCGTVLDRTPCSEQRYKP